MWGWGCRPGAHLEVPSTLVFETRSIHWPRTHQVCRLSSPGSPRYLLACLCFSIVGITWPTIFVFKTKKPNKTKSHVPGIELRFIGLHSELFASGANSTALVFHFEGNGESLNILTMMGMEASRMRATDGGGRSSRLRRWLEALGLRDGAELCMSNVVARMSEWGWMKSLG